MDFQGARLGKAIKFPRMGHKCLLRDASIAFLSVNLRLIFRDNWVTRRTYTVIFKDNWVTGGLIFVQNRQEMMDDLYQ